MNDEAKQDYQHTCNNQPFTFPINGARAILFCLDQFKALVPILKSPSMHMCKSFNYDFCRKTTSALLTYHSSDNITSASSI